MARKMSIDEMNRIDFNCEYLRAIFPMIGHRIMIFSYSY